MTAATEQEALQPVLVERRDKVLVITLNRPERRNAINSAVAHLLGEALVRLDEDDDLRVGVLHGGGGVFSAGMDLKERAAGGGAHVEGRGFAGIAEAPPRKPLVAAVEGWAVGGGFEIVLCADLVVASRTARFGLPEVSRGLAARGGGAFRLPRRIPHVAAMEILLTGQAVEADRAYALGLVNQVTEPGQALQAALELAASITTNAPLSLTATKELAAHAQTWSDAEAFARQGEWLDPVFASDDATEGAAAFLERRTPVWRGR